MLYYPTDKEIERLQPELKKMLSISPHVLKDPVPIKDEKQARQYLLLKVGKYKKSLRYTGSDAVIVDKYIANAMNELLAAGFTYANLYAKDYVFLTEPHVASALAFNTLNGICLVPDEVDVWFGMNYERNDAGWESKLRATT